MVADWTLKPSLATYDMRPDREYWYKPVLESGQDQDGSLVALVEHQVGLAAAKLRTGEHKRAIGILRRAAGVAAGYARAPPGEPPRPVAHAALALIHLQHCVVLSGMGSHGDAAEEARRARAETDEVWRVLQEASAAEDAAVSAWWEVGPLGAAGAPEQLKALLRKPPPWLSMLVEVAIQSRQCLALELEYQRPAAGLEADDETDGLHLEAALLAEQLLPEGHPVRQRAAQAHREAELRREAAANPGRSRRSSAAPASLALSASFGSARASSAGTPAAEAPASGMPSPPAAALPSAPPPGMMVDRRAGRAPPPPKRPPWGAGAPPPRSGPGPSGADGGPAPGSSSGSRRSASSPALPALPQPLSPQGPGGRRLSRMSRRSTSPELAAGRRRSRRPARPFEGPLPRSGEESLDPFEDWRRNVVDLNSMTLKQRKLATDEGQRDLQNSLKLHARRFKQVEMKAIETIPDRLYENRMYFSSAGVSSMKRAEQRTESWKQEEWKPSQQALEKRREVSDLFSFYGVNQVPANKKCSAVQQSRALRRLMMESVDRETKRQEREAREDEQDLSRQASGQAAAAAAPSAGSPGKAN
ncbi:unnamed protein product [Prorocentrum cordatum]|nr:unnamed protein product [Polarella glacialis]